MPNRPAPAAPTAPDAPGRHPDPVRRRLLAGASALLLPALLRPSTAWSADPVDPGAPTRLVRDGVGREIRLPQTVTRVASSWEAQNAVIAMLGFGGNIVATTRYARDMPAFRKLIPGIENVPLALAGPGELNVEELIRLRPQVLFMSSPPPAAQAAQLARAGIAIASFRANALSTLLERARISAEILGGGAMARAQDYQACVESHIGRVQRALEGLEPARRVSIYHAVGTPLSTSGRPSLNQDWMDLAGVRNVAEHWFGDDARAAAEVSIEQVLEADPDLIVAMRARDADEIRRDPRWRRLRAVREGRVHANPRGMFWWCRETTEVALQFLWLAQLAYPERFPGLDLRDETRAFYRRFYGVTLDDADVESFLHPAA